MAAALNRLEVGFKRVGTTVSIPGQPEARLMYYLKCISTVIPGLDDVSNIRRLRDYINYDRLSQEELKALLALCLAIRPDLLIDKCIFQADGMCGESNNEFYEINAVNTSLIVTESILIGGQRKRVEKIMTFKMIWLRKYYLQPFQQLVDRLESEDLMRRQRAIRIAEEERRQAETRRQENERQRMLEQQRRLVREDERREEIRRQQESCVCIII